jgi:hypothetical protein
MANLIGSRLLQWLLVITANLYSVDINLSK